ncbi:MAG: hypothetical protein GY877_08525 [Hyphomicrobium sp.]|nr:hypothetical protein [Hyphomicrobium sp.]
MGALAVVTLLVLSPSLAESRPSSDPRAPSNPAKVTVYLFWTPTCPHCVKAKTFLEALAANMPEIRLRTLELSTDEAHDRAFQALNTHFRAPRKITHTPIYASLMPDRLIRAGHDGADWVFRFRQAA